MRPDRTKVAWLSSEAAGLHTRTLTFVFCGKDDFLLGKSGLCQAPSPGEELAKCSGKQEAAAGFWSDVPSQRPSPPGFCLFPG